MHDALLSPAALMATLTAIRLRAPLVQNLTSAVVANFTANALLAIGASPAMVEGEDEALAFVPVADALVVNLGSLTLAKAAVMRGAAKTAVACGTPFVLDPVAAGAIVSRTAFALELCAIGPSAIRGNGSEILGLSGHTGGGRGVDSGAWTDRAIEAAKTLARSSGAVVAVTGATDYVTDGHALVAVRHGHPMMTRVTGMGCAASALVGACLAVEPDRLRAVSHALVFSGLAGERGALLARGPGSLAMHYLDALAGDFGITIDRA